MAAASFSLECHNFLSSQNSWGPPIPPTTRWSWATNIPCLCITVNQLQKPLVVQKHAECICMLCVRKRKAETWCVPVCSSYKRKAYGLQHHSTFKREKHFAANSLRQRSYRCTHRAILHLQFETRGFCKIPCCNLLHDGSESKSTCETKSVPNDANEVLTILWLKQLHRYIHRVVGQ